MECPLCHETMNRQGRFSYECPICGYSEYNDEDEDDEE